MTDPTAAVTRSLVRRLTTWGAGSVVGGGLLAAAGRTSTPRAFGVQTALWGGVDLAIAAFGARAASAPPGARLMRRILIANTVLDVGYIAAGAHLAVRTPSLGGRLTTAAARGHGIAVIVQGAALLVIDAAAARRLPR